MKDAAARTLTLPGLLLALVVTSTLPAWAGAASTRLADQTTGCAVEAAAAGDVPGRPRC